MSVSLRKSVVIYTFSNLLSTALPFILLPFLTFALGKEDYGVLSNFTGLLALAMPLVGLNFVSAYSRQFYKEEIEIEKYVGTGISLQIILASVVSLLMFLLQDWISIKTGIAPEFIQIVGVYCLIFGVSEIVLTYWRLAEKVWSFAAFRILRTIVEIGLTFWFILMFEMNYSGRIWGIVLAAVIGFIPVLVVLISSSYARLSWDRKYLKHMLRYGAPLIPHALGGTILAYSDKMIITNEMSLADNGVYSVAFQVALIIGLIQNSFNQAWVPWFYKSLKNATDQVKLKIVKTTYIYYALLAVATVVLIVTTPIIFMIIGGEFRAGSGLVFWIAIGFMFNGFYKMVVNYLFYMEKTLLIGSVTIFAAILNIALNLALIPSFGLEGAAIATASTFFVQFVIIWIAAQRLYPMPWGTLNFRK